MLRSVLPVQAAGASDGIAVAAPLSGTYSVSQGDGGIVITLDNYQGDYVIFYKKYTCAVQVIVNGTCSVGRIHVSGANTALTVEPASALVTGSITQYDGSLLITNYGVIGADDSADIGCKAPLVIVNAGIINAGDICAQDGSISIGGGVLNARSLSAGKGILADHAALRLTNDTAYTMLAEDGDIDLTASTVTASASTYAMYTVTGKIVLDGCMLSGPSGSSVLGYKAGQAVAYDDSDLGYRVRSRTAEIRLK